MADTTSDLELMADAIVPPPVDRGLCPARIVIRKGRIAHLAEPSHGAAPSESARRLVMPALCNAHDHARIVRNSAMGGFDEPLESWLFRLATIPAVDPWLAGIVAMGRMALGGVGAAMIHYTRVQGFTDYPTEAQQVIGAARAVGLRIAFAVQLRDRNPLVYGASDPILAQLPSAARALVTDRFLKPPLPLEDQLALVDAVAADHIDDPLVTVQYGPAGVQWCSDAMLRVIAERSAQSGRRVHMHLLETQYQRAWADTAYPQGLVHHLDEIGLLNERLSLAHCVWARPDELELIAARDATIVINTSSNLAIRSGVAALPEMVRRGCRIAMGLDGLALDEDEDGLRELRLNYALGKGSGYETAMSQGDALAFATANGRFAIDGARHGGHVAAGGDADLMSLDLDQMGHDLLWADVAPASLVLARATKAHLRDLHVAGRPVVREGRLVTVDLAAAEAELMGRLRAALPSMSVVKDQVAELSRVLEDHYRCHCGCG